jgi:hypothetical protein
MHIVCEMLFGSHLYGLDTPDSDFDYKGIILPTREDILLSNSKYHIDLSTGDHNSKNTKYDVDKTYYTLHYFIELACKGETVALDMLHGSADKCTINSDVWEFLVNNRHRFYTKEMSTYMGYCKKQSAKYGIKGTRLGEIERVLDILSTYPEHCVVSDVDFSSSDLVQWVEYKGCNYLEVCGSKYQDNLKLKFIKESLAVTYNRYGERTKLAKQNIGIDFKALSHCLRASYQVRDILKNGFFAYPLAENDFILQVKLGQLDFTTVIQPEIERIIEEVNVLAQTSTLPQHIDVQFWNNYIIDVHAAIVAA